MEGDAEGEAYVLTGTLLYQPPGELADVFFDADISRPKIRFSARGPLAPERADATDGAAED